MNPRIKSVGYKSPYLLTIVFLNNEIKEFDLLPYLNYPIYSALKDESFCSTARVMASTVGWNDEIDFDPDLLYKESKAFTNRVS
jgi:hypothetical protein